MVNFGNSSIHRSLQPGSREKEITKLTLVRNISNIGRWSLQFHNSWWLHNLKGVLLITYWTASLASVHPLLTSYVTHFTVSTVGWSCFVGVGSLWTQLTDAHSCTVLECSLIIQRGQKLFIYYYSLLLYSFVVLQPYQRFKIRIYVKI